MTTHDQLHRDVIIDWLNDAYEMEKRLGPALEEHAQDAVDYPTWNSRLQQGADECRRHIDLVRQCVDRIGGKVPILRGGIDAFTGWANAVGTLEFHDQLVKNLLSDLGAVTIAAAHYKALVAAATHNGDQEVADACRIIQWEKETLARWLYESVERAARDLLQHRMAA